MKRSLRVWVASAGVFVGATLFAQVPEITYDATTDLLTLPSFGEVAGVATDSKGQIFKTRYDSHSRAELRAGRRASKYRDADHRSPDGIRLPALRYC